MIDENTHLPRCPACGRSESEVVTIHEPKTLAMNTPATLRCRACQSEWEGLIRSPTYEAGRAKGWFR